jgi:hypothetical protein
MADQIEWTAPEFNYTPKDPDWYWTVGIIITTLVIISILSGNLLFAIVLIVGGSALSYQAGQKPELIEFSADQRGIRIDDTLYPYSSLQSFWVENNPHEQKLILQSEKTLMPYIIAPIEEVDPEELRHFLLQFLPEEHHKEPLSQKIMEYLGF